MYDMNTIIIAKVIDTHNIYIYIYSSGGKLTANETDSNCIILNFKKTKLAIH